MKEIKGNIWNLNVDAYCVTTNGMIKKNGQAVMGKGIALDASKRYPNLASQLATHLKTNGNHVGVFNNIITIPTKEHWKDPSPLWLIQRSIKELEKAVKQNNFQTVALTQPGCGLGGLSWQNQVKPLLEHLDDNFIVVSF